MLHCPYFGLGLLATLHLLAAAGVEEALEYYFAGLVAPPLSGADRRRGLEPLARCPTRELSDTTRRPQVWSFGPRSVEDAFAQWRERLDDVALGHPAVAALSHEVRRN